MSLSRPNPTSPENPVQEYIRWNSVEKCFILSKEKKALKTLTFLVLEDSIKMLRGYNDMKGWSVYSNKIQDLRSQPFTLYTDSGTILHPTPQSPGSGFYAEDKEKFAYHKAKYTQIFYVYVPEVGLCEINANGSLLGTFFELNKTLGIRSFVGKVFKWNGDYEKNKKGSVEYFTPTFETIRDADESGEVYSLALEADSLLQDYLDNTARKLRDGNKFENSFTENEVENNDSIADETDDLPF